MLYLFFLARYRLCDPSPFFRYFKWFSEKKKQDHLKKKIRRSRNKKSFFYSAEKNLFFQPPTKEVTLHLKF